MAFEIRYHGLPPLTGLFGADRELYWLQSDAEVLFKRRLTTRLRAHHIMDMKEYPATVAPAATFFQHAFLTSPILPHAQLCEAFEETTGEVHAFGKGLNDDTSAMYVLKAHFPYHPLAKHLPRLHMVSSKRVLDVPKPPPVLDAPARALLLDTNGEDAVPWFLWLCAFEEWAQEHVYSGKGLAEKELKKLSENVLKGFPVCI